MVNYMINASYHCQPWIFQLCSIFNTFIQVTIDKDHLIRIREKGDKIYYRFYGNNSILYKNTLDLRKKSKFVVIDDDYYDGIVVNLVEWVAYCVHQSGIRTDKKTELVIK